MFLPFLLSIAASYQSARPTFEFSGREERCPEFCSCSIKRDLTNIIWNCLSTVIICSWTSVHPNLPPPSRWRTLWNRLKLMFWMVIAPELILAWAVRQFFAAREIRDLYNKHKAKNKWTMNHGQFVSMGGYVLMSDDGNIEEPHQPGWFSTTEDWERHRMHEKHYRRCQLGTLTMERFRELIQDPNFEFPPITAAEIQDRSKGDALWKLLAVIQTTWFVVQCIARLRQRLALTELELITLALASLNAATFAFWWHKPLGVQEPVKIYLKTVSTPRRPEFNNLVTKQHNPDLLDLVISKSRFFLRVTATEIIDFLRFPFKDGFYAVPVYLFLSLPIAFLYIFTFPIFIFFPLAIVFLLRIIETDTVSSTSASLLEGRGLIATQVLASLRRFRYKLTSQIRRFFKEQSAKIFDVSDDTFFSFLFGWYIILPGLFLLLALFILFLIPFFTLVFLISFMFSSVFGIITTSTVPPGALHVPSFYAPKTPSDRYSRMVVFALFGVFFGGLHCIGWHFTYPKRYEQTLWRSTSLAITVIPFIVAPIDYILANRSDPAGRRSTVQHLLDLVMTILLSIYVPARLSLIVQAVALLRNQPPSAFLTIDWIKYIPHIL